MTHEYREIMPHKDLSGFIECFWMMDVRRAFCKRVIPDGCADVIFYGTGLQIHDARFVGVMTVAHDVQLHTGQTLFGIRFHPGMARALLRTRMDRFNDVTIDAVECLGPLASRITKAAAAAPNAHRRVAALEEVLAGVYERAGTPNAGDFRRLSDPRSPDVHGTVAERQRRRLHVDLTGLPPKKLACILRFRECERRLVERRTDLARLAIECSYFDQPHMVREFRRYAGCSPTAYLRHFAG